MKSYTSKIDEKLEKINKTKEILLDQINYADCNLINNTTKINQVFEDHNDFIHFAELMKVYEIYKWNNLKLNYSHIKKKTNLDKKLYWQIIKLYSNIINYFSEEETNNISNKIRKIQSENDTMVYNYALLQKKHRDILNKCKYLIKNDQIIKIYETNSEIEPLIIKLYENYINIKVVNKKTQLLKNNKSNILNEIFRINEQIQHIKIKS